MPARSQLFGTSRAAALMIRATLLATMNSKSWLEVASPAWSAEDLVKRLQECTTGNAQPGPSSHCLAREASSLTNEEPIFDLCRHEGRYPRGAILVAASTRQSDCREWCLTESLPLGTTSASSLHMQTAKSTILLASSSRKDVKCCIELYLLFPFCASLRETAY